MALSPFCNCAWSRWSHSLSPLKGQRSVLAGTRCYGGPANPRRTGPRRPARGCASGRCPARLGGVGGVESDVANAGGGNGGRGKTSDGTGREGGRRKHTQTRNKWQIIKPMEDAG